MALVTPEAIREIEAVVSERMGRPGVPGVAVGICDAGRIRWSRGFGVTGDGSGRAVSAGTMFSVQSVSKMYTAAAVLRAVREGVVGLDEPLTTYLPAFTVRSFSEEHPERKMTLRHLLSHTAGFTHEAPVGSNYVVGRASLGEHCRSVSGTWLRFAVGEHYEYSNLGIDLAGYVLQSVYRMPFPRVVGRGLLRPLGLWRSSFSQVEIARERDRAVGHSRAFAAGGRRLPLWCPIVPSGGLYTSVDDLLRFIQWHLRRGEGLIDPGLMDEMYRVPGALPGQSYGYGLGVMSDVWTDGTRVRGHLGDNWGFAAQGVWSPEAGVGVAVLTNAGGFDHSLNVELPRLIFEILGIGGGGSAEPVAQACAGAPAGARTGTSAGASAGARTGTSAGARAGDVSALIGEYVSRDEPVITIAFSGRGVTVNGVADRVSCSPDGVGVRVDTGGRIDTYRAVRAADGAVAYLVNLRDGHVSYPNRPTSPADSREIGQRWLGPYEMRASGVPVKQAALTREDGDARLVIGSGEGAVAYGLVRRAPGLFQTSTGEVLDLRGDAPVYANIRLHRT
jgi:CubicO group peptidase (beta-lactamase class C family)